MAAGNQDLNRFDKWLLDIGNGKFGSVEIPDQMLAVKIESEGDAIQKLTDKVFPDLATNIASTNWLHGRAILAATNQQVRIINRAVMRKLHEEPIRLFSADQCTNQTDSGRFTVEYLNTLQPTGFPPHELQLKTGMPLMLLRNLMPKEGLCNGTHLIFQRVVHSRILECLISHSNRKVLIPRIKLIPREGEFPFDWERRQFPVIPAFAMTINKSQGQTMKVVGLYLKPEVFTHGQLYVAFSRVRNPESLQIASTANLIQNVVYRDVLTDLS